MNMRGVSFLLIALAFVPFARADERPVRVLVGFPPGGEADIVARFITEPMRASLGAPVIVENKPGAAGLLAAEALKNAAPDGKTVMMSPIGVTVFAPFTYKNLRYVPAKDFAPVSLVAEFQMALVVGPRTPAKNLREYLDWARENPAKAIYGVPFPGGPTHFFGVMLSRATATELIAVPYKGSAPLINELVGSQVPAGIAGVSQVAKYHEAGKLRILATSGAKRSPVSQDVPTFTELGFTEIEGTAWQGVHTAAGTPKATIERLSSAIASAINAPEVRDRLLALGFEPVGSTPEEFARKLAQDAAKWGPIIKASGFHADQ
jgi:tripartite-type tricarboxylate transporter receptor subunit TctC